MNYVCFADLLARQMLSRIPTLLLSHGFMSVEVDFAFCPQLLLALVLSQI